MATSGSQIKDIHQALLAAYSRDELRQWLRTCMDESFEALVPETKFSAQLFALLEWADRQKRLRELVRCARENNPGNGALHQVWTHYFAATTAAPLPLDADIFLSYSRHDTALMHRMRAALLAAGFTVWTDDGLTPGTPSWQDRIEQAVNATRSMVVILSPRAKASKWVRVEVELAQEAGHAVFPVLAAGDTKRSAVPLSLWEVQYVDGRADFDAAVDVALLPALRQHFGRTAAASLPRSDPDDVEKIRIATACARCAAARSTSMRPGCAAPPGTETSLISGSASTGFAWCPPAVEAVGLWKLWARERLWVLRDSGEEVWRSAASSSAAGRRRRAVSRRDEVCAWCQPSRKLQSFREGCGRARSCG